ncbi:hypothetical protein AVEN_58256-1 [Araneus ventricosus]|uniref:Integrase catalytic domain-containing protein n=1 Tax=Araneus ventricosus TaxID=182803 RepID=A0A4Y2RBX7_ARAVE|nr:hypothetical protein AVEN_58256-1 [Araneus ventricosus]
MVDRFTRWPEAVPLLDAKAETVAIAFMFNWISRFGLPQRVACDQGGQFESGLFQMLTRMFGIQCVRTAAFHPSSNGRVERMHRPLKQALMCSKQTWFEALPLVLLGLRTVLREDINATAAELAYGTNLRVPGQFFVDSNIGIPSPDYLSRLQELMRALKPSDPVHHGLKAVYMPKDLQTCSHVFVKRRPIKRALATPFEGPFPVKKRQDKNFVVLVNGQEKVISVDRLKPAVLLSDTTSSNLSYTTKCGRKAALNMAMRVAALTIKDQGILVVNMCPGWVKTDMGSDEAMLEPSESISTMLNTFSNLNESHHGTLLNRNGNTILF